MKAFSLTVSSPDGSLFNGEVTFISARGVEGEFAIMAGHIPFITALVPCKIKIHQGGEEKLATVDGGLLTVGDDGKVTMLTGSFKWEKQ
ncbi:MAG: F0F1 ATP synthase subunit epsilon [Clostridia bacterium]|nr:F0F1 ATP synthase subunit epsilon [Clostridia bacterium]